MIDYAAKTAVRLGGRALAEGGRSAGRFTRPRAVENGSAMRMLLETGTPRVTACIGR